MTTKSTSNISKIAHLFYSEIGVSLVLMISLIFSASPWGSSIPIICSSSDIPKINSPPNVFANALTLLHQLS